jgi:hypothetical protein
MLQVWPGLRAPIKKLTQADDRRGNLYQVWVGKPRRTYVRRACGLPTAAAAAELPVAWLADLPRPGPLVRRRR